MFFLLAGGLAITIPIENVIRGFLNETDIVHGAIAALRKFGMLRRTNTNLVTICNPTTTVSPLTAVRERPYFSHTMSRYPSGE